MKIRNTTSQMQELRLVELPGDNVYTVYINPNRVADIQGAIISDRDKVKFKKGILEIVGEEKRFSTPIEITQEATEEEDLQDELIEEEEEEEEDTPQGDEEEDSDDFTPEVTDEQYICKECGAEFASERGLNTHMSRVHSQENE